MPWTRSSFTKHWKAGTPEQLTTAAHYANKILASGAEEGTAIATGIKMAKAKHKSSSSAKSKRMPSKSSKPSKKGKH